MLSICQRNLICYVLNRLLHDRVRHRTLGLSMPPVRSGPKKVGAPSGKELVVRLSFPNLVCIDNIDSASFILARISIKTCNHMFLRSDAYFKINYRLNHVLLLLLLLLLIGILTCVVISVLSRF